MHPQLLLLHLGAADVGVWAQQDVVQLRQLLVRVLDRLLAAGAALRVQLRGLQRIRTGLGAFRLCGRLRGATTRAQQACRCAEIAPSPAAPGSARSCAVLMAFCVAIQALFVALSKHCRSLRWSMHTAAAQERRMRSSKRHFSSNVAAACCLYA